MMALDTLRAAPAFAQPLSWVVPALATGWPELDAALPDHGLPRGVVELAAPGALGGGTSIALAAVRAAQAKDPRAWAAWVDAEGTLYGPAVAKAGVDLDRLLVVRPRAEGAPAGMRLVDVGRIAVKVAEARACEVIVVDGLSAPASAHGKHGKHAKRALAPEVLVRKLALAAERGGATVLLLTDSQVPRAVPWPVALRLELLRAPGHIVVKVAKERRGRVGMAKAIVPMGSRPCAA